MDEIDEFYYFHFTITYGGSIRTGSPIPLAGTISFVLKSLDAIIPCCTEIVHAHGLSPLLAEVQILIHVGEKMPLPTLGERHD